MWLGDCLTQKAADTFILCIATTTVSLSDCHFSQIESTLQKDVIIRASNKLHTISFIDSVKKVNVRIGVPHAYFPHRQNLV